MPYCVTAIVLRQLLHREKRIQNDPSSNVERKNDEVLLRQTLKAQEQRHMCYR